MEPKVFAAGDCTTGPATVVEAIASGRRAAGSIHSMLTHGIPRLDADGGRDDWRAIDRALLGLEGIDPEPRLVAPELTPAEAIRLGFAEVQTGATPDQSRRETARCLGCSPCARCEACIVTLGCPAFFRDEQGLISIDPLLCNGCGVCTLVCPSGAIVPAGLDMETA